MPHIGRFLYRTGIQNSNFIVCVVIVLIFIQINKSIHTTDIPAAINIHHSTTIYFTEHKCACYSLPQVAEVQASPCTLPTYHIVPGERPGDVVRSIRWQYVNSAY